jgi:biopolymer transport protein TolR
VKVNLPETKATPVDASDKKIVLSIDKARHVFIGEVEVQLNELEEKLRTNAKVQQEKELYLHADRDLAYGVVVEVMAAAQKAGVANLGMVTDPMGASKASKEKEKDNK